MVISWNPQWDINLLDQVQRRVTKWVMSSLEHESDEGRLKHLGLSSLSYRRTRDDLVTRYNLLSTSSHPNASIFPERQKASQGKPHTIVHQEESFQVHYHFLSQKVASIWNAVQAEVTTTLSVNNFRLDKRVLTCGSPLPPEPPVSDPCLKNHPGYQHSITSNYVLFLLSSFLFLFIILLTHYQ